MGFPMGFPMVNPLNHHFPSVKRHVAVQGGAHPPHPWLGIGGASWCWTYAAEGHPWGHGGWLGWEHLPLKSPFFMGKTWEKYGKHIEKHDDFHWFPIDDGCFFKKFRPRNWLTRTNFWKMLVNWQVTGACCFRDSLWLFIWNQNLRRLRTLQSRSAHLNPEDTWSFWKPWNCRIDPWSSAAPQGSCGCGSSGSSQTSSQAGTTGTTATAGTLGGSNRFQYGYYYWNKDWYIGLLFQ